MTLRYWSFKTRRKAAVLLTVTIMLSILAWYLHSHVSLERLAVHENRLRTTIDQHPWQAFAAGFFVYTGLSLVPGTGGKAIVYGWLFGFWQAMIIVIVGLLANSTRRVHFTCLLFEWRTRRFP